MRFHIPSFNFYLKNSLPADVAFTHHDHICYIMSSYPLRMDVLQQAVLDAVYDSFETPIGTLDGADQRSLIAGLPDAHWEALKDALTGKNTYLKKTERRRRNRGEDPRFEYQINLRTIQKIIKDVRLSHDAALIRDLIDDELFSIDGKRFVSLRKVEKLLFYHTGKAFSTRRIDAALHELTRRQVINGPNGYRRRFGREVRT